MGYERYRQGQRDPRDFSADRNDAYTSTRDDRAAGPYDRGGYGQDREFDRRPTGYYGNHDANDRGGSQRQGDGRSYRGNDGDDHGRQRQGTRDDERGFLDRAGDEVRSWFGDDDAERRREQDARHDRQRDADYHSWRSSHVAALDRDYDEYRSENRTKFHNEFSTWRTERQGQRNALGQVAEHQEVVGSDGSHVGTVDKVRGDRILLTRTDQDAGGKHHSIPSRWIDKVDDKVTLRKTAEEAKAEWRDEERNQAFFGEDRDRGDLGRREIGDDRGAHVLNRSFSGTY